MSNASNSGGEAPTRLEAFAKIPAEQRFTWKIVPLPGRLLFADTIGKSLSAMNSIFKSVGEELGQPVVVSVLDIRFDEDGALVADLVLMPKEAKKRSKTPTPNTREGEAK